MGVHTVLKSSPGTDEQLGTSGCQEAALGLWNLVLPVLGLLLASVSPAGWGEGVLSSRDSVFDVRASSFGTGMSPKGSHSSRLLRPGPKPLWGCLPSWLSPTGAKEAFFSLPRILT